MGQGRHTLGSISDPVIGAHSLSFRTLQYSETATAYMSLKYRGGA